MLEDIHPNQQAKQAKIVAGFEARIHRLEQEMQALKALLLESQDFHRKLARRVDDLQVPAKVIEMPAAVVADVVAPPAPSEAEPAPVVEAPVVDAVVPDKKPAQAPKKAVPAKKKDSGNA